LVNVAVTNVPNGLCLLQDRAREVFGRFAIEGVPTTYTVATVHRGGTRMTELIVSG
jgi:hypothetical protein